MQHKKKIRKLKNYEKIRMSEVCKKTRKLKITKKKNVESDKKKTRKLKITKKKNVQSEQKIRIGILFEKNKKKFRICEKKLQKKT